jgi:hypothetical protein
MPKPSGAKYRPFCKQKARPFTAMRAAHVKPFMCVCTGSPKHNSDPPMRAAGYTIDEITSTLELS